jgi:hypothetical protein
VAKNFLVAGADIGQSRRRVLSLCFFVSAFLHCSTFSETLWRFLTFFDVIFSSGFGFGEEEGQGRRGRRGGKDTRLPTLPFQSDFFFKKKEKRICLFGRFMQEHEKSNILSIDKNVKNAAR